MDLCVNPRLDHIGDPAVCVAERFGSFSQKRAYLQIPLTATGAMTQCDVGQTVVTGYEEIRNCKSHNTQRETALVHEI